MAELYQAVMLISCNCGPAGILTLVQALSDSNASPARPTKLLLFQAHFHFPFVIFSSSSCLEAFLCHISATLVLPCQVFPVTMSRTTGRHSFVMTKVRLGLGMLPLAVVAAQEIECTFVLLS